SLITRKVDDFQKVAIRVAEIERADSSRILVPVRKALWPGRCVLDLMFPEAFVRPRDVAHNDGDVLEHPIVRTKIVGHRPPLRRQVFGQFDLFSPEAKPDDAGTSAKNTRE